MNRKEYLRKRVEEIKKELETIDMKKRQYTSFLGRGYYEVIEDLKMTKTMYKIICKYN